MIFFDKLTKNPYLKKKKSAGGDPNLKFLFSFFFFFKRGEVLVNTCICEQMS